MSVDNSHAENISQSDVKHITTSTIKIVVSVLKVSTDISLVSQLVLLDSLRY